jgi:hypothetical protein
MQHEGAFHASPEPWPTRIASNSNAHARRKRDVNQPSISAQDFQGKTVFGGFDQGFNRLAVVVTMEDLLGVGLLGGEGGIEVGIATATEALRH